MSFKKRETSKTVERGKSRITGMETIDKNKGKVINYGGDEIVLTKVEMQTQVDLCEAIRKEYNQALEAADIISNRLAAEEAKLKTMCNKILSSAKGKFDGNADEIEILGGTRTSDRKKPVKKNTPPK
ncbi:MAG: hypothetical protein WC209_08375 [Ignavibacteriaceae bacterium]|jgi:hypothetical protein